VTDSAAPNSPQTRERFRAVCRWIALVVLAPVAISAGLEALNLTRRSQWDSYVDLAPGLHRTIVITAVVAWIGAAVVLGLRRRSGWSWSASLLASLGMLLVLALVPIFIWGWAEVASCVVIC
jgi:hypothetical protein